MKSKIICMILLLTVLFVCLATPAAAYSTNTANTPDTIAMDAADDALRASPFIMDYAGILTPSQVSQLEETALEIAEEEGIALYILTLNSFTEYHPSSVYEAATSFYNQYMLGVGSERNGTLLLLSMRDRDFAYISYGNKAERIFSDRTKISIEEDFLYYLADNRWYDAFDSYMSNSEYEVKYGFMISFIVILLISFVLALLIGFGYRQQLKSVKSAHAAAHYVPQGGINIAISEDNFSHTTTVRTKVAKSGSGGGGRSHSGGGFSGRSGKF